MKIQALKSCAGLDFAYYEGEIANCRDSVAKDLISAGYAKEIKPAKQRGGRIHFRPSAFGKGTV